MNLKEFTEKYGNKEVEEEKLKELLGMKVSKAWEPEYSEEYWCVGSFGDIYKEFWENMEEDKYKYSIGNCYKTEEEAVFARDKQIFTTKLERDFAENSDEIDWGNMYQNKYQMFIYGDDIAKTFYNSTYLGVPVTTNREWLEKYIKENEADIKKYYFGKGE